ncbi:hypothetical protein ACVIIW_001084 [Bradyrhizobium sp. USDA 4449]
MNEVLCMHLYSHGFNSISARLIGNARLRIHRGGIKPWSSTKRDILGHLKNDPSCIATLMVDFYGLPSGADDGWPGRAEANALGSAEAKVAIVQSKILDDIAAAMGSDFDRSRFVPFVLMHEFEALLFSDCARFAEAIGQANLGAQFQQIRDGFQSPEEINDSPVTAPSKRIAALFPSYQKILHGNVAVLGIGLQIIRDHCPNFRAWLERLEHVGAS